MEVKSNPVSSSLEQYFEQFRLNTIGHDQYFETPYGRQKIIYADWIASGRLYQPIENKMVKDIAAFVGNTHTETSVTGTSMTLAYHKAKEIIKKHVNASQKDVLITTGSGMTGVVNKFQRILGLKVSEKLERYLTLPEEEKPVVFVTHMEHHSNHTSWLETVAKVECIEPCGQGLVNLDHFASLLEKYKDKKNKFAAITSCSNVTGIMTPYSQIARMIHEAGGYCFVDFACSAPYVKIDMHPEDPMEQLDAIYFSPHKFLGGPGTPGVLVFNSELYANKRPDNPGGGTVSWTNPWGEHRYLNDIEAREDGGTPGFLQTIRTALCIQVKDQMGIDNILNREKEILSTVFKEFKEIEGLHILAGHIEHRIGAVSFCIDDLHYNLGVKLLNDRFGIQVRGGCSCAGTYGHYLLEMTQDMSSSIREKIDLGDLTVKPGWIRLSIHPTMSNEEVAVLITAIKELANNHKEWNKQYIYDNRSNEYHHISKPELDEARVNNWFKEL